MSPPTNPVPSLRAMYLEVQAEGREWMRRRLEQKLQAQADRQGRVFPQSGRKAHHRRQESMRLRSGFGEVALEVWRGKYPADGRWGIPIRAHWGLTPHQQLSPALEDQLAYFATVTGCYEAAAKLAAKVSCPVEDSTVQALVQRLGTKAEAQTQARLKEKPPQKACARAPTPLAVVMVDGFQVRFRGPGWGQRKTDLPRVEWHESKLGVFYRHEQAARATGGERRRELAGRGLGAGPSPTQGSPARRAGSRQSGASRGRWCAVDMEHRPRSLAARPPAARFLPRQPAPLDP